MSEKQTQNPQNIPPATPEAPKTSPKTEKAKAQEAGKFKLSNLPGALSKAWESLHSKENKDKGFLMKVGIFFSAFFDEMKGIEKEKKEVSKETKAAVDKDVGETMKDAKSATALKDTVEKTDKEFYDEVLAMAVASNEELGNDQQADVYTGLNTLNKAVKGEAVEALTLDQAKAMGGAGIMTLSKLKAKFDTPAKFKEALDRLDKISVNSNFPLYSNEKLKGLLSMPVLNIFKVNLNLMAEGLQSAGAALGSVVGISVEKGEGMKFMESFGLSVNDALKLKGIKENPIKDEQEVVGIMQKAFFPSTSPENVGKIAKTINTMIVNGTDKLDTQTLTDLVFNIADSDTARLIEILTGKKSEGAKVA